MKTATELLKEWEHAIKERDEALSQRNNNMFLGPMRIEEHLETTQKDVRMCCWFLHRILPLLANLETQHTLRK